MQVVDPTRAPRDAHAMRLQHSDAMVGRQTSETGMDSRRLGLRRLDSLRLGLRRQGSHRQGFAQVGIGKCRAAASLR